MEKKKIALSERCRFPLWIGGTNIRQSHPSRCVGGDQAAQIKEGGFCGCGLIPPLATEDQGPSQCHCERHLEGPIIP